MFRYANLKGYEDLIYPSSLFASPRLDLGFPVRIRRIFLIYYAAKPFNGIRARSMRRCVSRVERNMLVAGVDVFCYKPLVCVLIMTRNSEIEAVHANFTRPRSRDRLRTGLFHTCGWWMPLSLTIVVMGFTPDVGNHNI